MIKKLLMTLSLATGLYATAQCTISGKSTINVLSEETYSVSAEAAQCKDCHLWVNVGGNTSILGDHKQNSVKLKAKSGGREVISLSVLTPQGFMQCSKNIDIVDANGTLPVQNTEPAKTSNCDVEANNYKEVKYADQIVSFFPNVMSDSYRYSWTVLYFNGSTMSSTEKVPQFPFTKDNGINKVTVKIHSSKCMKEFSKTYDGNYWKFFQ